MSRCPEMVLVMLLMCLAKSTGRMLLQADIDMDSESADDVLRQPLMHSTNTVVIVGELVTLVLRYDTIR